MSFAYLSGNTFLKVSAKYNKSKPLAVAGICWDGSVTNRPGTRFGPSGIRTASHMLCDGYHPHFDTTPIGVLTDAGDFQLPNTSLEDMRSKLKPQVLSLLKQHHMVWLGGDHSITFPLLQCYHQIHGAPIAVLHFDAHCDTWSTHFDEPSGHGTWVYEAIESGVAMKECFFQFGIRSSGIKTVRDYIQDRGGMIYTGRDLRGLESPAQLHPIIENVCTRLKEYDNPPVYLSFDIDCLDPAFAPGTGTPEPGGLTSNQALTFIEEFVTRIPNIIGMDLVEVAPAYDHAQLTTNVASTVIWTYMCGMISKSPEMKLLQVPPHD